LGSAAPEQYVGYVPGGDHDVAEVQHVGAIGRDAALSPLTKPEYDGVIAGTVRPAVIVGLEAVIVNWGSTTLVAPGLGVEVTVKSLQFEPVDAPSGSLTRLSPSGILGVLVDEMGKSAVKVVSVTVGITP
jgi:hypothetical protein